MLFGSLLRNRSLIWAFASRDLRTRYRSSVIGWAWSLLQPLAQLAVFAVVFSVVFRIPAPPMGSGQESLYVLYLFTGMVAWNMFSGLLTLSMGTLRGSGDLLRKVYFPPWAPVLGSSLVQLVQVGLETLVLLIWFIVVGNIGWTWLAALPLMVGLALFSQGVGLWLSVVNARYGDVQYIVGVVLGAMYFLTPVIYPLSAIPASAEVVRAVVAFNPVSWYVIALHDSLYLLVWPTWWAVVGLLGLGAATFTAGLWYFDRSSEDIGELL